MVGWTCSMHYLGGREMGFFTRRLVPRKVRRLVHPVRAVRRKVTPKPIKRISRATGVVRNPVSTGLYAAERAVFSSPKRSRKPAKSRTTVPALVYRHGSCSVKHRTPEAAGRCRRNY